VPADPQEEAAASLSREKAAAWLSKTKPMSGGKCGQKMFQEPVDCSFL